MHVRSVLLWAHPALICGSATLFYSSAFFYHPLSLIVLVSHPNDVGNGRIYSLRINRSSRGKIDQDHSCHRPGLPQLRK